MLIKKVNIRNCSYLFHDVPSRFIRETNEKINLPHSQTIYVFS